MTSGHRLPGPAPLLAPSEVLEVWMPAVIALHVGCGILAVVCGVGAMLTRKGGRRHRRLGRAHLLALTALGATAPVLAAVDWVHRWHLVVLGGVSLASAAVGYYAVRLSRPPRRLTHLVGMSCGYISMLTAFYVDNGPRLPLWDQLPDLALWLLPTAVGAPLVIRAARRHRRGPAELRAGRRERGPRVASIGTWVAGQVARRSWRRNTAGR